MMSEKPALSFVIPLYNSEATLAQLVREIEDLAVPGGHEIILVNDGSRDRTNEVGRDLVAKARIPVILINHTRNFGEHNAVLTGWRQARGDYIINLDDDGQNPPAEGVKMWRHATERNLDVVFGHYRTKQHSAWRNFGSWFTNRMTDWALDKPRGFYLSSFRCVSRLVAEAVSSHAGPFPYLDGLILQVTQRIGSVEVEHAKRTAGTSGYTFRRLIRLWMSAWINFSVLPLRIATVLGLILAVLGLVGLAGVAWLRFTHQGPAFGWGSLMAALLIFSGTQLLILGVIGEYIGRMFISVNRRPQSVVREVISSAVR
jgi:glycosyltransferase involved in cell wall biosynthesis